MSADISLNSFSSYNQTIAALSADLKKLREYSERLRLNGNMDAIDAVLKKLTEDSFNIAVIGEFKRGKSTLINALLGNDVLPMDVLPTTATLNRITYSARPFVQIKFKDGRQEEVGIGLLRDYVTKLTRTAEETAKTVEEAIVHYPVDYCKNNVDIIDTPGLNDEVAMTEVAMSVLSKVDAALMVIMAQSPFSESERAFLESKMITNTLGRIMFVVTGVDLLDEEDVDRVLNSIEARIEEHVMIKAAKVYGEGSAELDTYMRKIGKVRVFGLSAKKAMKAKIAGDREALEKSRFPAFESELERFLVEDRSAVMLGVPVSRIFSASSEVLKAVAIRENALQMRAEEFNEKYNNAMEEIETIRQYRQEEFERVNISAQKAYDGLKPILADYWPEIEAAVSRAIDSYALAKDDLSNKKIKETQECIWRAVKEEVSDVAQTFLERIQNKVQVSLENEMERLEDFQASFFESTSKIQDLFFNLKQPAAVDGTVLGTVINMFSLGIGANAFVGYKKAGAKGALVGGLTGTAHTLAGFAGVGVLLAMFGVTLTAPVMLVAYAGASLFSALRNKAAIREVFHSDSALKFKQNLKDAILKHYAQTKTNNDIAIKVWEHIESEFTSLKDRIQIETENILLDMQNTLLALKNDLTKNTIVTESEKEGLKQMLANTQLIISRAERVNAQLAAMMARG